MQASACSDAGTCDQSLDCLEAAGTNTLHYAVFYEEAYYHSDLLPHRSFDSLAYLVPRAHSRGMEVYALIPVALVGWSEHPEWNARLNYPAVPQDWLDFAVPEARAFVADLAEEIITDYEVDGILLDYTRWSAQWSNEAGLSCAEISLTVQGVHDRVNVVRPDVHVAASPSADIEFAKEWWKQDWVTWLNAGWVDYVTPLAYIDKGDDRAAEWCQEWSETGHFPNRIIPRVSTCWFKPEFEVKPVDQVLGEIQAFYDGGATGMTLWGDRYICQNAELVDALEGGGW